MQNLDLWMEYIETTKKLPLFDQHAKEYAIPTIETGDWSQEPQYIARILENNDLSGLIELGETHRLEELFSWLHERDQKSLLLRCYDHLLAKLADDVPQGEGSGTIFRKLMGFLTHAPYLSIAFGRLVQGRVYKGAIAALLEGSAFEILRAFILSANQAEEFVATPLRAFLSTVELMSLSEFADLVQLISLTVRSPEVALNVLLGCLEPEATRILPGEPPLVRHFVRNIIANALDHIGEAAEQCQTRDDLLEIRLLDEQEDGYAVVEIPFRIDAAGGTPQTSAHVRLTAASLPKNVVVGRPYSIDALVIHSQHGLAKLVCYHPPPPFVLDCSWNMQNCGPFVTTKTSFDAIRAFAVEFEACCGIAQQILGLPPVIPDSASNVAPPDYLPKAQLNQSQNAAVETALKSSLTCLWGPPGTGKTETIVEMIRALQVHFEGSRILVTAPTHNAVDNVMRRYITKTDIKDREMRLPLRVSTDVSIAALRNTSILSYISTDSQGGPRL